MNFSSHKGLTLSSEGGMMFLVKTNRHNKATDSLTPSGSLLCLFVSGLHTSDQRPLGSFWKSCNGTASELVKHGNCRPCEASARTLETSSPLKGASRSLISWVTSGACGLRDSLMTTDTAMTQVMTKNTEDAKDLYDTYTTLVIS